MHVRVRRGPQPRAVRGKDRVWQAELGLVPAAPDFVRPYTLAVSPSPPRPQRASAATPQSSFLLPGLWCGPWETRPRAAAHFVSLQALSCVLWERMSFLCLVMSLPSEFSQDADIHVSLSSALPAEFTRRLRSKEAAEGDHGRSAPELSKAAPGGAEEGPEDPQSRGQSEP